MEVDVSDARLELRDSGGCTATADTVRDVALRGAVAAAPGADSLPSTELAVCVDCECDRGAPSLPLCAAVVVVATDVVVVVVVVVVLLCGVGRREGCSSEREAAEMASWRANIFFWKASAHRPASRETLTDAALPCADKSI